MIIDRTVGLPLDKHTRLKAVVAWYENMPNEEFGDRFHEKVTDIIAELMPHFPEFDGDDPSHFYNCPEIAEGRLVVDLISCKTGESEICVEIVPEC